MDIGASGPWRGRLVERVCARALSRPPFPSGLSGGSRGTRTWFQTLSTHPSAGPWHGSQGPLLSSRHLNCQGEAALFARTSSLRLKD